MGAFGLPSLGERPQRSGGWGGTPLWSAGGFLATEGYFPDHVSLLKLVRSGDMESNPGWVRAQSVGKPSGGDRALSGAQAVAGEGPTVGRPVLG